MNDRLRPTLAVVVPVVVGVLGALPAGSWGAPAAASRHSSRGRLRAKVVQLRAIAPGNEFPVGPCANPFVSSRASAESQVEPTLAVNPRDPRNLIVGWFDGSFELYGVAVSRNAGAGWKVVEVPGYSHCTGGELYTEASDEGLSFGPDGTAYFDAQTELGTGNLVPILVSRSANHGLSWSAPVTAAPPAGYNDKQRGPVLIDPRDPQRGFLAWRRGRDDTGLVAGSDIFFSTTRDGGRSWSPERPIYLGQLPGEFDVHNTLFLTPARVLVDVWIREHTQDWLPGAGGATVQPEEIMAMSSRDLGASWSTPVRAATTSFRYPVGVNGSRIEAFPSVYSAIAPDGTIYTAWNDIESTTFSRIWLASTHDGGLSWSKPSVVEAIHGQAFLPAIAVEPNGTLGITWYDTRRDVPGSGRTTTDVWFAGSADRGARWSEIHLAGSFDMQSAPPFEFFGFTGPFVGDYTGLAGIPGGFAAAFAMAKPRSPVGQSTVYFARIRVTRTQSSPTSRPRES